ncbi:threonylcarbamoyl-AMP synthase [Candidatus Gottesmanbacteria bacterium]|nr:threonylcarbamoyl-AMP synthase [Candidatus Gottesmanbacteria bacterium]
MSTDSKTASKAIEVIKRGGIVIFPTDTAFGIGCRIDNHKAVDRLFKIRKRPLSQPMPVLVSSVEMALAYLDSPSDIVRRLMSEYWPGALTIVASCKENLVYSPIRGNGKTIGVRMPDHETILAIIRRVGVPILGPSANFHGQPTPFRRQDLDRHLISLVDLVVPGVCKAGNVSTVIDCSVAPPHIIRQGAVTLSIS